MKKVFKIIGIVVIVIVALVIAYQIFIVISDKIDDYNVKKEQEKLQEERINAKTLMEYVKTHDYKYIQCNEDEENCDSKYYMEFTTQDFKCDALDNIKTFNSNYFITKDNEIYDISFYDLYSNNQNCKKATIDTNIKAIKGEYVLDNNNKLYTLQQDEKNSTILKECDYSGSWGKIINDIMNNGNIHNVLNITRDYSKNEIYALILKNDNNLYKLIYKVKGVYPDEYIELEKEELYKSLEEYGNIQHIDLSNFYSGSSGKNYQLEDNTITTIISDKGYYYLEEIKTDECIKYKDIECKLELKESEIYKRFSKDIKFIGKKYTILSDNSIIETRYLTYPLDKDLKN